MKKACKRCKLITEGNKCECGSTELTETWKGTIIVLKKESEIAKKLKIEKEGTYAIKIK